MHINLQENILVLPICTMTSYVDNEQQWEEYYGGDGIQAKKIKTQLFEVGADKEHVYFYNYYLNNYNDQSDWSKTYAYLVIPGGDADLGTLRANQLGLVSKIRCFKGSVIAYSAGALMLYEKYFLSPNWYYKQLEYCRGLNIREMPSWLLEVHYDGTEEMDRYIFQAGSELGKEVFAVTDDGLICYDSNSKSIESVGEVYKFNEKNKQKIKGDFYKKISVNKRS